MPYRSVLAQAVRGLKRVVDFNSHYVAHLLGQTSERDFQRLAETFTTTLVDHDPAELAEAIRMLLDATDLTFSTTELSDIFGCKDEDVVAASGRRRRRGHWSQKVQKVGESA